MYYIEISAVIIINYSLFIHLLFEGLMESANCLKE
jgi:hypothetical protein